MKGKDCLDINAICSGPETEVGATPPRPLRGVLPPTPRLRPPPRDLRHVLHPGLQAAWPRLCPGCLCARRSMTSRPRLMASWPSERATPSGGSRSSLKRWQTRWLFKSSDILEKVLIWKSIFLKNMIDNCTAEKLLWRKRKSSFMKLFFQVEEEARWELVRRRNRRKGRDVSNRLCWGCGSSSLKKENSFTLNGYFCPNIFHFASSLIFIDVS